MNSIAPQLAASRPHRRLLARIPQETWIAVAAGIGYVLFPKDLGFLTNIFTTAILVVSLSLVLGQAGIATMGQAALFGSGAYAAGLFALHVSPDPLLGLLAGAGVGAIVALLSGAVLLRANGLTLVMLSIAAGQILMEVASKARVVTGGDDGLSGFTMAPVLGLFTFDFEGFTAYFYSLWVLLLVYFLARKIVDSPFGLTCRAIRSDRGRMESMGCNVYLHLLCVYTIGGALAGIGGAVSAQTASVVSLSSLDFNLSAGVLVMLVLGGTRKLPGAIIGTITYMIVHHVVSTANPYHWLFVIGIMLIVIMVTLPGGLIDVLDKTKNLLRRRNA